MNISDEYRLKLTQLTDLFERNRKQYNTSAYDEANTRTDFIDKFFELLGWDIRNEQGYSEQYREVVREDKVTIAGRVKAPDYAFRIGGVRKFFVEAKKPSVNIKDELEPAFQVRRYGYTAKLPLCILTDFEEFAVYDTRIKPSPSDKPSTARIFYCTFDEYHKHFDFIFNTFSKEAILKGSFDTYIQENKNKKGTSEVDKELLKLIEGWRTDIAKNIALRNPSLNIYHLNTAVQKIIDRIIFLRIAEDKEMEEYGTLLGICGHLRRYGIQNNTQCTVSTPPFILGAVPSSCSTYSQKTFDSHETESGTVYQKLQAVFDRANAKYNSGLFKPHDWLRSLTIDDTVLSSIINGLYYPECPYEFSILPVEILGNIYEQFLGKIIKFRNVKGGHTALIEEKPEVKKAGGVYYTPQYIVRYIVENTIGVKIKGQSPDAIAQLKVIDPACGSGSFLVEAYQQLLNYHLDYYSSEKQRKQALKNSLIYETGKNVYKLTIEEKQRILLNNIYGVDIDGQAVEVTKLSLYLKLLENEGSETQGQLFKFSDIKLLPSLDSNIKCGNSLVGSDYYNEKDVSLFDDEAMRKINTFDWDKEFPEVFVQGGFDCVIGNPPYVLCQPGTINETLLNYYKFYKVASYKIDLFHLFFEKSIMLLANHGMLGFITPNTYLTNKYIKPLREYILRYCDIDRLVIHDTVFLTASVDVATIILNKKKEKEHSIIIEKEENQALQKYRIILQRLWEENTDFLFNINQVKKIEFKGTVPLGTICNTYFGIQAFDRKTSISFERKNNNYFPIIDGEDIFPFAFAQPKKFFDYRNQNIKSGGDWEVYNKDRIVVRQIGITPIVGLCKKEVLASNTLYSIWSKNSEFSLLYILCILNSKLLKKYWTETYSDNKLLFPKIKGYQLKELPIKNISSQEQAPFINLANQMLETQGRLQQTLSDEDKKLLEQRAAIIDTQIDKAVYQLYGLTEEEVKIVEGE